MYVGTHAQTHNKPQEAVPTVVISHDVKSLTSYGYEIMTTFSNLGDKSSQIGRSKITSRYVKKNNQPY